MHFTRLVTRVVTDTTEFNAVRAADIARGLAAEVNGDPITRFDAVASGATVTVRGPAFMADLDGTWGTSRVSGVRAFAGDALVTLAGPVSGTTWTIEVDGRVASFTGGAGDSLAVVADGLRQRVAALGLAVIAEVEGADGLRLRATKPIGVRLVQGGGAVTGTRSTTHWAEAVIELLLPNGPVPVGALFELTLSGGTAATDIGIFTFRAGARGDASPKAVDTRVTDDDAPGLLVTESGGSTQVTEPTRYVVLGEGFVTRVLGSHQFSGDFGLSIIDESGVHNSPATAQDLGLADWNRNANPNISDATTIPHLTVRGTGDGDADWYRITVTPEMLAAAGGAVSVTLDVDRGYEPGDPILWLSLLELYDEAGGRLLARGPGFSNPLASGRGGSSSWLDDFLTYTVTTAGSYLIRMGSWLLSTGLPVGVDYELHVSVAEHPTSGFVFAPQPVLENEGPNPQVLTATEFFRFFDPQVGNGAYGGTVDFTTPYARIQGSGDGSFDLFQFTVTPQMLDPAAGGPIAGSSIDAGPFFTSASLRLTGAVRPGDGWTLGLRYRDITFTADATPTLLEVAQGLRTRIGEVFGARFTVTATDNGDGTATLTIADPRGFNLQGLTVNGVQHRAVAAGTITRTFGATRPDGTALAFAGATVQLLDTFAPGDQVTLFIGSDTRSTIVLQGDTPGAVAGRLRALTGGTATVGGSGAQITITAADAASGVPVRVVIAGAAPAGTAQISGTPIAAQAGDAAYTRVEHTMPATVRPGETYRVTVTNLNGTGPLTWETVVGFGDTPEEVAEALESAAPSSLAPDAVGRRLILSRATPFRTTITVLAAGSTTATVAPGAQLVQILRTSGAGDSWRLSLRAGSTPLATVTLGGASATTVEQVASGLAAAVTAAAPAGVTATSSGDKLLVARADGAVTAVLELVPDTTVATSAVGRTTTAAVTVELPNSSSGDQLRLQLPDLALLTATAPGNVPGLSTIAANWAAAIDASPLYAATSAGRRLTIARTDDASLASASLVSRNQPAGTPAPAPVDTTIALTPGTAQVLVVRGTPTAGDTYRLLVDPDGPGSAAYLAPVDATVSAADDAEKVATLLGDALAGRSAFTGGTAAVRRQGATLVIFRLDAGAIVVDPVIAAGAATVDITVPPVASVKLTGSPNAGDTWRLTVGGLIAEAVADANPTLSELAAALAAALATADGVAALSSTEAVTVARIAGAVTFALTVVRSGAAALPSTAGEIAAMRRVDLELVPGGPLTGADEIVVIVDGITRTVDVASGDDEEDVLDRLAGVLPTSTYTTSRAGQVLTIRRNDGTLVAVGPVRHIRPGATGPTQPADGGRTWYLAALVELAGEYVVGERWSITLDGRQYEVTLPDALPEHRTLGRVAQLLIGAVNNPTTGDSILRAESVPGQPNRLRIVDRSTARTAGDDPFTVQVRRGGGTVRVVLDVDRAGSVNGTVPIRRVPPEYRALLVQFPWLASYFPADLLDFTATTTLRITGPNGFTAFSDGGSALDAGSVGAAAGTPDPFLDLAVSAPGTYTVEVGSKVRYAAFTRAGVENVFFADELTGVAAGLSYDLLVSVDRHATNPNALTLVDKKITIVEGAGRGQWAVITAYDAEGADGQTPTYTLDRALTGIDETSRFEIADEPAIPRSTDSYDVVLTGRPTAEVVVDVSPIPTRTYDASRAFDPSAGYGEAFDVQVEAATRQARVRLTERRPSARPGRSCSRASSATRPCTPSR
jgi:hypothetical protein